MRTPSGQFAVTRSRSLRLLTILLLLISLVAVGVRPSPATPARPDRFRGAVAASLTDGTDPVPAACDPTAEPETSVTAVPDQPVTMTDNSSTVDIDAGSVGGPTKVTASAVCDIAPLDDGMTNVTASSKRGFRFLPHMTFKKNLRVAIPYDPTLVPAGMTEQDIRTYYYDETTQAWQPLDLEKVDTAARKVRSLSNHFTDMIAATVTVPDHPGTLSFDPTAMKDVKTADPAGGIDLIEAPQANSHGDAKLAYPIAVPRGRQGRQPSLTIGYSSSAGNGWLGVGWDLSVPGISVDTRWGVPRYDAATETETYSFNSGELTPVAHRGPPQARTAEKTFHTRVEGPFQRIVRHGNSPATYWWEVTEKDGSRSFFGGDPQSGPAPDARLADGAGHVFRWALRETRDLHGNTVRFSYQTVSDPGIAGGTVAGTQLYLRSINYTGSGDQPGPYTVTFVRDSERPNYTRRSDVLIDARGGFKMVTAELLSRIDVTFNGGLVRRYDLAYAQGAFGKTLLQSITQSGANGTALGTHRFSYFDEVRQGDGSYNGFAQATSWNVGDDGITAGLLDQGRASALSGALNTSVGGHLYVGFNPLAPTKQGSAGAKVGFTSSSTDGVLALVDLNGDNLPDKVFKQDGRIQFRLNTSGPAGGTSFAGSQQVPTLPGITEESSSTFSFGAEAYLVANVFVNQSETFTTTSEYFADVNGDGLTDLVQGGQVLFNHLGPGGVPTFTANSADTPVPIGAGTVDGSGIVQDLEAIRQQQIDNNPLEDTIRRWEAPFDGRVRVTGDVALVQDTSPARAQYRFADGVRTAIQHNGTELWSTQIAGADYSPRTPAGVDSITVAKGDRLYFRVQSGFDGRFDQVSWDPVITYLDVAAATDANGLAAYRYQASEDFTLAGRPGMQVQAPFNGTLRLSGDLHKAGATTDDITLLVLKNGATVFSQSRAADFTGDIPVGLDIPVVKGDSIQLRVRVDSPIDVRQVQWTPSLSYTASPDVSPIVDGSGRPLVQLHPPYDIDLYPVSNLTAPQQAFTVPADETITVSPHVTAAAGASGTVTFTVKRQGALLAKRTITIASGAGTAPDLDVDVHQGDRLFFDFSALDPQLGAAVSGAEVRITEPGQQAVTAPSAVHRATTTGLLAEPYRGWTYAGYNGNRERAAQPIAEGDLTRTFDQTSQFDPRTAKAYPFMPFPEESSWRGADDGAFVKAATASSSRMGLDTIAVPTAAEFAGARAVDRLSRASQTAVGGGISFLSGSISTGTTSSQLDYLDLNGDHFPDVVGDGRVQYTTPTGALEAANRTVPGLGSPRDSDATAANVGVGGSPASFTADGRAEVDSSGHAPPKSNTTGSQMVQLGLAGGLGKGTSDPNHELLDVNGDGLPDRVSRSGDQLLVALNLGYSFAPAEPWGGAAINDGASENGSIGATLGFNGGIYDFAGGLSLTKNKSQTSATLHDLNGDGLLDRVLPGGAGGVQVAFNTGNGFAAPVAWNGALEGVCRDSTSLGLAGIDWDHARVCSGNTGLGAGAYFTIGIPLCVAACYLIINPGADGSQNMSRDEATLRDIDGDGNPDHLASTSDGQLRVALNQTGRTNLLRSISRPLGASIGLEYQRDGNTVADPTSHWVLSRVSVDDGHPGDGVDVQVKTFTYAGGVYNRLEREFFGYGQVTEEQRDPSQDGALYRSIVHEFRTDSFYTQGLPARQRTFDAGGHVFADTGYTYVLRDVGTGAEPADAASTTATIFPQLVRTDDRYNEGLAVAAKSTFTTNHYDALGNVDVYVEAGEAGAADDVRATIGYTSCPDTSLNEANAITVSGGGAQMRRREATIECATGNVTQVRQFLADGSAAVSDMAYTADGALRQFTGPANANGQRSQVTYVYDATARTYVERTTDSFGLTSTASFDLRFGATLSETDVNGNRTSYTLDEFGRTTSVTGPYQQGGPDATIRLEFHPEAAVPWAVTHHLDSFRDASDPIDTVTFIDGLRRQIQIKKDATVFTGPNGTPADVMSVSGHHTFDAFGRDVALTYGITEPLGTPGVFNPNVDSVRPTRFAFDVADRNTSLTRPDDTTITTAYGFGSDRSGATQFRQLVTDANGHQKATYRDVREELVALQEFHTPDGGSQQSIWTTYAYDPLKELVQVRDDAGNTTSLGYDNLGRRTFIDNPDTGRTETVFDKASNQVARITANLRALGQQITLTYDFNRLVAISYPDFPENNVAYTYGAPGAADNRAGRVTRITDESGAEDRFYGRLGEVTRTVKTIVGDTGSPPKMYTTSYTYDTFGRLQSLVYPDTEVLTYKYDSGGMVRQATGVKGPNTYAYVTRLEYDKFGQRAFVEDGNGVRTSYTFDPLDRRLTNLQAGLGATLFQNDRYTYDNVGNLTNQTNDVPVPPPPTFGGPVTQTFAYDDLNRLVGSTGIFQSSPDKTNRYTLTQSYDNLHDLTSKQQVNTLEQPSGTFVTQKPTTYSFTYAYDASQPHAPSHIGQQTFTYDANGNQTGFTDDTSGQRRSMVWDEDNRLQSLSENGHTMTYKYDDGGERVIKRGPQGQTEYVNQWFTIRNGQIGTKHVFVGETRVVSKLMKQNVQTLEKDLFFFHSDSRSSTNYVTDGQGRIFEHLEYLPSGETWVEDSSNTQRTPFLFGGKELDEETQLYYFGARYYDPRTGVWQSTDPALASNLGQLPEDASESAQDVDTSVPTFLNVYAYADANPASRVDPDGRQAMPLDTFTLRTIARSLGIGAGLTGVQFNRAVGRAFQDFALQSFGLAENFTPMFSPARQAANAGPPGFGLPASVVPDSVRGIVQFRGFEWPPVRFYGQSSFFEVKAVNGMLTPESSRSQILGLIDVAARSPAGSATGPERQYPYLTLITTSNTGIDSRTVDYATRRGVQLWWSVAYVVPGGPTGYRIGFTPPILLNPTIGEETTRVTTRIGALPRPFAAGGGLPLENPLDPDPAEVE
jgi:RHS repeat-associated protein